MSDHESTLGLRPHEIAWLQANQSHPNAAGLIRQYQLVVTCPSDPGARGIFAGMLAEARKGFLQGIAS